MTGEVERDDAALWRRWRDGRAAAGEPPAEPDALLLAAYAEHRLGRAGGDAEADGEVARVEAWLAAHPERLDDIAAARRLGASGDAGRAAAPGLARAVLARAEALIAPAAGTVVPYRAAARPAPGWRSAAAWSGIAASLVVACLIGFSLGSSDWLGLAGTGQNQTLEQEFIGTQTPVLYNGDLDTGI